MTQRFVVALVLLLACAPVNADVIYATFDPNNWGCDPQFGCSGCIVGTNVFSGLGPFSWAASFTPSAAYTLDTVQFVASWLNPQNQPGAAHLRVAVAEDLGGAPGAVLDSVVVPNIEALGALYGAAFALHPAVSAGSPYWVVLTAEDPTAGMVWSTGSFFFLGASFREGSGPWEYSPGWTPGFVVNGTAAAVPEPSSVVLLGLGLAGVALGRAGRPADERDGAIAA